MNIGILREEKVPVDKRVPFSPSQCKQIITEFPELKIFVQSSDIRCFSDEDYLKHGIPIVDSLESCDVLFGIKEVPKDKLIANKTYLFFSHTIKKQEYNRELLKKMIKLNIRMIDYEVLKYNNGSRILGFGRYAGIIGAYNGLLTYGLKHGLYQLKPANKCIDRNEMDNYLNDVKLSNEKFLITGKGRVGSGILETIKKLNIEEVNIDDYLNKKFSEPVYLNIDVMDYNERIDGGKANFNDFVNNPSHYKSSFMKYVKKTDIFIAGHYYGSGAPFLFTRNDVKSSDFNISVIADVSCDIDGPVATTIKPSSITNPIYGYNPITENEDDYMNDGIIAVMAVDNLPCELPKDSSQDFGEHLIKHIVPIINIENQVLEGATICKDGDLAENYEYLRDYVNS
jgi:saccharopine dehydrogenase (NAD+, L-lysine-forming)